ncbi:uncharacterized protein LOC133893480 [Phragmites australis]|uniref:uncharacterized protein LOC133893480 n=1 Tax=Phragmites australis TaxID=29695 RepID=UPI002D78FECF|nr:uncharacterized protein LOC133893480 [Phragmites australis]
MSDNPRNPVRAHVTFVAILGVALDPTDSNRIVQVLIEESGQGDYFLEKIFNGFYKGNRATTEREAKRIATLLRTPDGRGHQDKPEEGKRSGSGSGTYSLQTRGLLISALK